MADYRVVDIETVPDFTVWTPPAPRYNWTRPVQSLEDMRFQGVLQPELVADEPFPPPQAHRVVAVAWVDMTSKDNAYYQFEGLRSYCLWRTDSEYEKDVAEAGLVRAFAEAQDDDHAQLVSWNGRGFDLPVLNMRAMKHKIAMPWYYQEKDVRYRYTDAGHCDLMDFLGDYGAGRNMKLGDVARLIGLPGKIGDVAGNGVAKLVAEGDDVKTMNRVRRYCAQDAVQTAIIFVRSRYHKGMIEAKEHDAAIDSFAAAEQVVTLFPEFDFKILKVKP